MLALAVADREQTPTHDGPPAFAGIDPPAQRRCTSPDCAVEGGAILSRYNTDPDGLCSPCQSAGRRPGESPYDIASDPEAPEKVIALLINGWRDHPGEPVYIGRTLGTPDVWTIRHIVDYWRHLGHVIDAEKGQPGYTWRGCRRAERWARVSFIEALRHILRDSKDAGEEAVPPEQMGMLGEGGEG